MSKADKKAEDLVLEQRKVRALEKIALSLDSLTMWFEEIDKEGWSDRVAWYLSLWKEKFIDEGKPSKSKKNA
jgi:hypothetical protein|tara:strand:- start:193 stop:408 length:216 start_codon:yes stop_codon:yes gene_type:complete